MTAPVYVIDDDPALAESILALLQVQGIACRHFDSADRFLEDVGRLVPGCVLLDVFMPGTDGIEALRVLRGKGIAWPVIVTTSDDDPMISDFAWIAGAVEFIPKPWDSQMLISKVKSQLARLEPRPIA
jgi:two-component system response regulator FixJ